MLFEVVTMEWIMLIILNLGQEMVTLILPWVGVHFCLILVLKKMLLNYHCQVVICTKDEDIGNHRYIGISILRIY